MRLMGGRDETFLSAGLGWWNYCHWKTEQEQNSPYSQHGVKLRFSLTFLNNNIKNDHKYPKRKAIPLFVKL